MRCQSSAVRKRWSWTCQNSLAVFPWSSAPDLCSPPHWRTELSPHVTAIRLLLVRLGNDKRSSVLARLRLSRCRNSSMIVIRDGLVKALASTAKLVEEEVLPQYALPSVAGLAPRIKQSNRLAFSCLVDIGDDAREVLLTEIEVKIASRTTRWLLLFGRPLGGRGLSLAAEPGWRWHSRASWPAAGPTYRCFCSPVIRATICYRQRSLPLQFACADGIVRFRPTQRGLERLQTVPDAEINWVAAELSQ